MFLLTTFQRLRRWDICRKYPNKLKKIHKSLIVAPLPIKRIPAILVVPHSHRSTFQFLSIVPHIVLPLFNQYIKKIFSYYEHTANGTWCFYFNCFWNHMLQSSYYLTTYDACLVRFQGQNCRNVLRSFRKFMTNFKQCSINKTRLKTIDLLTFLVKFLKKSAKKPCKLGVF